MNILRRIQTVLVIVSVLCAAPLMSQAQAPKVNEAPPLIEFPNWKLVDESDEAQEYLVSFPSALTTKYPENNTVQVRVFIPLERPRPMPIVLVLHYWGARDLRVERSFASELSSRGIATAVMTLPYHLSRTPIGSNSGEMAIQPDTSKLVQTMTQSVLDVRRTIDFLQSRPEFKKAPLGLAGTSLGAIVSSLSFALDSRVTHATFLLGGADLGYIVWNSSRLVAQRDLLKRQGYTPEKLHTELSSIEPTNYLPRTTAGRTFLIRGKFDTVVPRTASEALESKLPDCSVLEIDTGHYGGIFVQRRPLGEMANFFSQEFEGKRYTAPAKLIAPTVRIGLVATTGEGLNVVAGLDIWRDNQRGDRFASFLVTPRYPMIFAGTRITSGLVGGIGITPRNIGVGIFWSSVL